MLYEMNDLAFLFFFLLLLLCIQKKSSCRLLVGLDIVCNDAAPRAYSYIVSSSNIIYKLKKTVGAELWS